MEEIMCQLISIDDRVLKLKKTCKDNNLAISFLSGFHLKKMGEIYARLKKHYQQNPSRGKSLWFQCQLKLFKWILICYSCLKNKKIQNFEIQDWESFRTIFLGKDIYTFKFEIKRLTTKSYKNQRSWSTEQDQILTTIMENPNMRNKWSEVARSFYQKSGEKYFRTSKQCREHWMNHLDPAKEHGKWNLEEDLIILKYVISNGKKWSVISKNQLPHRTEHMIKNRFKSLLNRFRKTQCYTSGQQKTYLKNIVKQLQRNPKEQTKTKIQMKQEDHQISQGPRLIQPCSLEQNIKEEPSCQRKVVVSNVQKIEDKPRSRPNTENIIQDQPTFPSIYSCNTPNVSSMYGPSIFGFICQTSIICLPFTSYETQWSGNSNGGSNSV